MPRERNPVSLALTGIGMVTPLGLDAFESCASIRAGISLMRELDDFTVENDWFEEVPVVGCSIPGITDGMKGLGRWTRLAARALEDVLEKAGLDRRALDRAAISIALPPLERPGVDGRIATELAARLAQWLEAPGLHARVHVHPEGHAGFVNALLMAREELASRQVDRVIVGGVDSLVEPETLAGLLAARRLKTEDHVDGVIPGEAAAFLMIERIEDARARKAAPLALIEGIGIGQEPHAVGSEQPSQAAGLAEAIEAAFADVPGRGADTALVVCDLNGESYRAREFGTVVPRSLAHLNGWTLWHPADSIGDTGAAAAAVATCVAARAIERGHLGARRALVFAGSVSGLRVALTVSAAS